jgi:protein MpaA
MLPDPGVPVPGWEREDDGMRRTRVGRRRLALALAAAALVLAPSSTPAPALATGPTTSASASAPATGATPTGYVCRTVALGAVTYSCVIGRSVDGRAIVAQRQGNPAAHRILVVVGQMHGEEWAGPLTVDVVRSLPTPATADYRVWTVRTMNPDGGRIGRRLTSHGVDLNGNFPTRFAVTPTSGPRPLSEPESRAMARFLTWVQPDLVISLHGFSTAVDTTGGGTRAAEARTFGRLANIGPAHPIPCGRPCTGNMTDWYTATALHGGVAFTVEMPRSSRTVRSCGVPGRRRGTTIQCAAWAAVYLAARLPA